MSRPAAKRSKRSFRIALSVVIATFAILAGVGAWAYAAILSYPDQKNTGTSDQVLVIISRGMKFPAVAAELKKSNIIDNQKWFRLYAMHKGQANKVRAGEYKLGGNLSPREVLKTLVKGVKVEEISVTIPEGKHILEVFDIYDKAGVAPSAALRQVALDPSWLRSQGIDGDTPEGYLFPDTYRFRQGSSPKLVLEKMIQKHRIVFDELKTQYAKQSSRTASKLRSALKKYKAPSKQWGDREFVIMASIIEKEAVVTQERRTIASVFYNRLTMSSFGSRRLETDPTIRYGCTVPAKKSKACRSWNKAGRLFTAQLRDQGNLYNTYRHSFLPPGPIGNPGRASLAAALNPERGPYLFFVAKKDKRHHVFSRSFAEHSKWVNKYQR